MKESTLKKEFKHSDVERIRNLVKRDFTSSTKFQVGYEKEEVEHKEGDIWEENGKTWTIKNGLKQSVPRLQEAKRALFIPLVCPKCGGPMEHHLSKKMYRIHGFCFDCTVKYEDTLRRAGLYEKYEKSLIQGNMKAYVKDLQAWVTESLVEKTEIVSEDGTIEDWGELSEEFKNKVLEDLKDYVDHVMNTLK